MSLLSTVVHGLQVPAVGLTRGGRCIQNDAATALFQRKVETESAFLDVIAGHLDDEGRQAVTSLLEDAAAGSEARLTVSWTMSERTEEATIEGGSIGAEPGGVLVVLTVPSFLRARADAEARQHRLALLGQLSGGVVHELNNVISIIAGWAQLASREIPEDNEKLRSALRLLDENSRRALAILGDLLGLVRGDEPRKARVTLGELADKVVRVLSHRLDRQHITVVRRYEDQRPLFLPARKLFQVLLNVVLNAMQAMPDGGEMVIVTRRDGSRAVIEVHDSGHGMDEATLARAFEPHFTTKSPGNGLGGGSGLGLWLSRRFVEESGGQIAARSVPGEGTTIIISLPAEESVEAEEQLEPSRTRG